MSASNTDILATEISDGLLSERLAGEMTALLSRLAEGLPEGEDKAEAIKFVAEIDGGGYQGDPVDLVGDLMHEINRIAPEGRQFALSAGEAGQDGVWRFVDKPVPTMAM